MITLTFRSGESLSLRRDHTLPILQRDNSIIMQCVHELSPGAIVRGRGIVILMEFHKTLAEADEEDTEPPEGFRRDNPQR